MVKSGKNSITYYFAKYYVILGQVIRDTWACITYYFFRHFIFNLTLTGFTLHFSCCFTKLLHSLFITLLNNFTMQEKCY